MFIVKSLITSVILFLCALFITGSVLAQPVEKSPEILVDWEEDFDIAIQEAKNQDKDILIYFWADWCGPCHKMDEWVFSDPDLGPAVNQYIALKVNTNEGEGPELRKKYKVQGYPDFVFLNKDGEKIGEIMGTRLKPTYLELINNRGRIR